MMMFLEWDFWVFVAALSIAAFSPGPGLAAIVATVLATGARRTLWFCAGIILGDLVWLSLSLSGLALIAQQIPAVFLVIKWAGAAYLVYLAFRIWRSPGAAAQAEERPRERSPAARILAGFSITMGNPKAMLFYLALLPNLVSPDHLNAEMVLSLSVGVIGVLSTVFAIYIFAAEKARTAMQSAAAVRRFNRVTATALGGAAAWIISR